MPFLAPLIGLLGGIGGTVAAASSAVGAGLAISSAVSKPKVPPVPNAAAADAQIQTEADKAASDLRAKAKLAGAGGRQATILTSPLGVTGPGVTPVSQKTLLGS